MNLSHYNALSMNLFNTIAAALTMILICFTSPVHADTGQPTIRVGKHCPSGYRSSGDYCVPRSGSTGTPLAIEKRGTCPSGYSRNGEYCAPKAAQEDVPHIIEKKGSCPSGYKKSGEYISNDIGIHDLPGNHDTWLVEHAKGFGDVLDACIQPAEGGGTT